MDRRLKITDEAGHGLTVKSKEWRQAVEKKIARQEKGRTREKERAVIFSQHRGEVSGYDGPHLRWRAERHVRTGFHRVRGMQFQGLS